MKKPAKIRAKQIITQKKDPTDAIHAEIFVTPSGELKSQSTAIPLRRLQWMAGTAVFFIAILALRSFYLEGGRSIFRKQAEENRLRLRVEYAPRGVVFDKNGTQLVENVAKTALVVYPSQLPSDVEREIAVLREIFPETPVEKFKDILIRTDKISTKPIPLLPDISHEKMVAILARSSDLPGIAVEKLPVREYKDAKYFAHLLGYVGKISEEEYKNNSSYLLTEYIGKSGIEKSYESKMRGVHGTKREEVDSTGITKKDLGLIPAKPGLNLKLNIDAELQKKIYDALSEQMKKVNVTRGAAVAIDPKTGGVMALVSIPSFDNSAITRGLNSEELNKLFSDPDLPMLNRTIQGEYPPGSTFKISIAIAGLEEKIVTDKTAVLSTGGIRVGSWFFPDWKSGGHGRTDLYKAIAESVNTYFYTIGGGDGEISGLGIEKIKNWALKLGFGQPIGIDIPGESDGFLPSAAWKQEKKKEPWYIGDTYHASIGQGDILVTPLQIASLTATVGNGGNYFQPKIANSLLRGDGGKAEELSNNIPAKRSFSASTAEIMRRAMRESVLTGSARALLDLPVSSAGKTGTAQTGSGDRTHAWFTSFAPYENPEIALTVLLEEGGAGDKVAVPVADEIYRWYFSERNK